MANAEGARVEELQAEPQVMEETRVEDAQAESQLTADAEEARVEDAQEEPQLVADQEEARLEEARQEPQVMAAAEEARAGEAQAEPQLIADVEEVWVEKSQAEPHVMADVEEARVEESQAGPHAMADVEEARIEAVQSGPTAFVEAGAKEPCAEAVAQVKVGEEMAPAPDVKVNDEPQVRPAASDAMAVEGEGTVAVAQRKAPPSVGSKRRPAAKVPPLEGMVAKIKSLQREADQGDAAVKEMEAAKLKKQQELQEMEDAIAAKRSEVNAKRAAAQHASQEYVKKQCEAALAELESNVPKRPAKPFFLFCVEQNLVGLSTAERNKKNAELWASLSREEKQKYHDKFAAAMKNFNEWGSSEEGQKNLRERSELMKKCKAAGKEELDKAMEISNVSSIRPAEGTNLAESTPVKRRRTTPDKESPALPANEPQSEAKIKPRRPTPARVSPASTGPVLDEKVIEEASKSDLLAQLRNLAARPDVSALGKSSEELLGALKASNGIVNAAKRSLCG